MASTKKHHVIMLHEHSTETTAWTELEGETADEMEHLVGTLVLTALRTFRDECLAANALPKIELKALTMESSEFEKLDRMAWDSEMEGLVDEVERGVED